jgi:hypothetical protein
MFSKENDLPATVHSAAKLRLIISAGKPNYRCRERSVFVGRTRSRGQASTI